jgi:transposase-like protein
MACVVETLHLENGLTVESLRHYRCRHCGSRFYDDEAIHRIQAARKSKARPTAIR